MNTANRSTRAEIEAWLKPVLEKENLKNYEVVITGCTEKGDNFLGDVTFLEVNGKSGDTNEDKTYNFVVKCGKKSKELRDFMPVRSAFENEMYFYNEVLPVFRSFQKEKEIENVFNNLPKCYATMLEDDMEVLILENMKVKGYSLHDRRVPMDLFHIKKIVKIYGKLHALSYGLRDQKPELFKKLASSLTDIMKLLNESMGEVGEVTLFDKIIELAKKENDEQVIEKAKLLTEMAPKWNDYTDPSDPFAVILHGDCWNNNFMFKYEDENEEKLSDVCLLDFQISRLASPVYDLSYFLFTALSEETVTHFDEINNAYYESLSGFLRELGSDPDKLFPFEELTRQWKRFGFMGLILMPSIITICLADKDEVHDLAEEAEAGTEMSKVFDKSIKNIIEYGKRTLPILRLAIKKEIV